MTPLHARDSLEAKEVELEAAGARVARLRARLASATAQRAELGELLGEGEDGLPLAMAPLSAALVGAVAANAALFFAYVIILTRFHEAIWNALLALSMLLGLASLPISARQGAGGAARRGLRRFALAGLGLAFVGLTIATMRL